MSGRLFRLMLAHQRTDEALRRAENRRIPDWFEIKRLKKAKLRVKDLIARLTLSPRRIG